MTLATAAQMKELDRVAIEERGIPSLELMENAAKAVAEEVLFRTGRTRKGRAAGSSGIIYGTCDRPLTQEENQQRQQIEQIVQDRNQDNSIRVAVFCGPGNNGGDGVAAARLLMEKGCTVRAFLVGDREKMTPDARTMEEQLEAAGGKLEVYQPDDQLQWTWFVTCDAVVDALFGVGLKRPLSGDFLAAVQQINRFRSPFRPVVSCDIPSGVNADTGEVLGDAVCADATVTFTFAKPGLYLGEGRAHSGEVVVARIGIPFELEKKIGRQPNGVDAMDGGTYVLPRRPRTAHKGDFGKVFILAGSEGYTGAPVMAANAAVRTGAGLVFLGVPRNIYPIVAVKCDEAMPFPLGEDYGTILEKARACDVALIGPGLGRSPETEALVLRLLADLDIPVVLDADGINALSGHIDSLDNRRALTVLTPHEGEFHRLTGCELPIQNRLEAARNFSVTHGCVLVLKGHGTVTASPEGKAWICGAGNPGMAKGGSGDVLAGVIAALLGQKHLKGPHTDLAEVAACGVYYHAQAGDLCAKEIGEYGMTPTDLIAMLPRVLKEHEAKGT